MLHPIDELSYCKIRVIPLAMWSLLSNRVSYQSCAIFNFVLTVVLISTRFFNLNPSNQYEVIDLSSLPNGIINIQSYCKTIAAEKWKAHSLAPNHLIGSSRSEYGQDVWMRKNIFEPLNITKAGRYVEFGARDGILGSNSYLFEQSLNWTGLLVEGLNSEYEKLLSNRPSKRAIKKYGLLCATRGQREYVWASGDKNYEGWGGLKEELIRSGALAAIEKAQKNNPALKIDSKMLPCLNLNELLAEAKMKRITLLSADCEGCELEVFTSLNWSKYSPVAILTEKAGDEKRLCQVIEFLMLKGYVPVNWESSDVIYLHQDYLHKLPASIRTKIISAV